MVKLRVRQPTADAEVSEEQLVGLLRLALRVVEDVYVYQGIVAKHLEGCTNNDPFALVGGHLPEICWDSLRKLQTGFDQCDLPVPLPHLGEVSLEWVE